MQGVSRLISLIRRNRIECRLDIPLQVGQAAVGGANSCLGLTPSTLLGSTKPSWAEEGLDCVVTASSVPTPPDFLTWDQGVLIIGRGGGSRTLKTGKGLRILSPLGLPMPNPTASYFSKSSYLPSSVWANTLRAFTYRASPADTRRVLVFMSRPLRSITISAVVRGSFASRSTSATCEGRLPRLNPPLRVRLPLLAVGCLRRSSWASLSRWIASSCRWMASSSASSIGSLFIAAIIQLNRSLSRKKRSLKRSPIVTPIYGIGAVLESTGCGQYSIDNQSGLTYVRHHTRGEHPSINPDGKVSKTRSGH